MKLHTLGRGKRMEVCTQMLADSLEKYDFDDVFLLPIPSTRDKIHITGTDITVEELSSLITEGSLIVGYGIPPELAARARLVGAEICDTQCDERFLKENAELTAHGTAGVIMTRHSEDISELKIGIIGYGRIGKILCRILLFLGADVVVFTRRESTRLDLCGIGIDAFGTESVGSRCDCDIIINTAPAKIITAEQAAELISSGTELMELASGEALPDVEGVVRLPSIPDKMYPVSAGRIYARSAIRQAEGRGK